MRSATGYFLPGNSWLHRRNPFTKLLGLLWVLLAAFLLPPAILAVLVGLLVLLAMGTGLLGALLRSLRIPAVLIASILIVNGLFFPGASQPLASLGPFSLSREGLSFGLIAAGRILVAFMASILFLVSTLADDLMEALIARGASHRIAFVVLSAMQLVPRLSDRADAILAAQQARGLSVTGSLLQRVRALFPLIGPILLGSLIDVRERTFALEARAFGARAKRTAYRQVPDPRIDRWLRLAIVAGAVGVIVVAATGIGR